MGSLLLLSMPLLAPVGGPNLPFHMVSNPNLFDKRSNPTFRTDRNFQTAMLHLFWTPFTFENNWTLFLAWHLILSLFSFRCHRGIILLRINCAALPFLLLWCLTCFAVTHIKFARRSQKGLTRKDLCFFFLAWKSTPFLTSTTYNISTYQHLFLIKKL